MIDFKDVNAKCIICGNSRFSTCNNNDDEFFHIFSAYDPKLELFHMELDVTLTFSQSDDLNYFYVNCKFNNKEIIYSKNFYKAEDFINEFENFIENMVFE